MTFGNRVFALLLLAVLLLFAPAARATDGVVLINQNTSVNGLPGCPHAGLPIVICQSGSYRLTGNLAIPGADTDGIDINADNVTLDLNGFTISGPAKCTPGTFPVQCTPTGTGIGVNSLPGLKSFHDNITVRNGTVRGMGNSGVLLNDGALVEDLHVESNAGSGTLNAGISVHGGVVTHCTVEANAGHGIAGTEELTVSFNSVALNGGNGIFGGGVVSNNSIFRNGQDGINAALLASYNSIFFNIGFGVNNVLGFVGNLIGANSTGTFASSTSMGHNLCDASAC